MASHTAQSIGELLTAQGPYPARVAEDQALLTSLAERIDKTYTTDSMTDLLRKQVPESPDEATLMRVLRDFKRTESMRSFAREVEQRANVRQTTAEIADIAQAALTICVEEGARLLGDPTLADGFCVLGMGKLGGRELNFSSDVDLIYICEDDIDEERGRNMERLAKLVTRLMDENTSDGYVFRVDLRLRPEGTRGPVVQCIGPMVEYYASFGRTWERSALLKARPVAGNLTLGNELLTTLDSFIYRKYLDFTAIEELKGMKDAINRNAQVSAVVGLKTESEPPPEPAQPASPLKSRLKNKLSGGFPIQRRPVKKAPPPDVSQPKEVDTTGLLGWDLKIGIGGIREIEFFVQALQLVHSGTQENLRVKNTLDALDRLLYRGLIADQDHQALCDAYGFLRLVEHRVQMQHDRQGHRLPQTSKELAELAARLELSEQELRERLIKHRTFVQNIFGRLFEDSAQESAQPTVVLGGPKALDTVLATDDPDEPAVLDALKELGFERPRQVAGQLSILREKDYGPFSRRSTSRESELGEYILKCASSAPDPDQSFSQLTRFLTLVGARPGFYSMLAENPHATRLLLHVFGSSAYLSSALLKEPAIFSRLVGAGTVKIQKLQSEMQAELTARLEPVEDPEHRIGVIRRYHQEETLRVGLHETGGAADVIVSTRQLSYLAEVVIQQVMREVYEPLRTRRRRPGSTLPEIQEIPFGVVGMGKLGGHELGFGSDLDMIFVYEDDRQWRLEHSFFSRLAQRIVRTLSSAGTDGKMYEVDTRLRPSGQQGALVVSLEAFEQYHLEQAALWERQALLRARLIAGNPSINESFETVRRRLVFDRPVPADATMQINDMVERIREANTTYDTVDVKFGKGGLVDIEFLVQSLQLECTQLDSPPENRALSRNTHEAIKGLAQLKRWDVDFDQLGHDYLRLRVIEARLRIADQRADSQIPNDPQALRRLARRVGFVGEKAGELLLAELDAIFERVVAAKSLATQPGSAHAE